MQRTRAGIQDSPRKKQALRRVAHDAESISPRPTCSAWEERSRAPFRRRISALRHLWFALKTLRTRRFVRRGGHQRCYAKSTHLNTQQIVQTTILALFQFFSRIIPKTPGVGARPYNRPHVARWPVSLCVRVAGTGALCLACVHTGVDAHPGCRLPLSRFEVDSRSESLAYPTPALASASDPSLSDKKAPGSAPTSGDVAARNDAVKVRRVHQKLIQSFAKTRRSSVQRDGQSEKNRKNDAGISQRRGRERRDGTGDVLCARASGKA